MHHYLDSVKKEFNRYKTLGEKTIEQLPEDKLFWQFNPESNSLAILVKHLSGNMLSRWTDFLNSDGEKEWREREKEFDNDLLNKMEILSAWEKGWTCLFNALNGLQADDLGKTVYIRAEAHTVVEAIHRQLAHYAYHVGQMVYIGKMAQDAAWTSLSVPRGKSEEFNKTMLGKSSSNPK